MSPYKVYTTKRSTENRSSGLETHTYHKNRIQVRAIDNFSRNNDDKGAATVRSKVRPGLTEKPHEPFVSYTVATRLRVGFREGVTLDRDFPPPINRRQRRIHRSESANSLPQTTRRRREFPVDVAERKGRGYRRNRHGRRGGWTRN